MIPLQIILDIETSSHDWSDLDPTKFGKVVAMGRLRNGTQGGASTVTVRMQLPDGSFVYGETTLALLRMAMVAFEGAEQRDALPKAPGGEGKA